MTLRLLIILHFSCYWCLIHGVYVELLAANYGGSTALLDDNKEPLNPPPTPIVAGICGFYPLAINDKLLLSSSTKAWSIVNDIRLSSLFCKYNATYVSSQSRATLFSQILSTCNKLYSSKLHEVYKHVVPFVESISISKWCSIGHSTDSAHCDIPTQTFSTIPYLCTGTKVPTSPLDVPQKCQFGHFSLAQCSRYEHLRGLALKKCQSSQQSLSLHSFEPLFPCDNGDLGESIELLYRVAEYVCCPRATSISADAPAANDDPEQSKVNDLVNEFQHDKSALRDLWLSKDAFKQVQNLDKDFDKSFQRAYINEQKKYASEKLRPFLQHQRDLADQFAREESRMRRMVDYVLQEPYPDTQRKAQAFHEFLSVIKHRLETIVATHRQLNYSNELLLMMAQEELLHQAYNVSHSLELFREKLLAQDFELFNTSLVLGDVERIVNETNGLLSRGKEKTFLVEQAHLLLEKVSSSASNSFHAEGHVNSTDRNIGMPVLGVSSLATLAVFNVLLIIVILLYLVSRSHLLSYLATKHKTCSSRSTQSQTPPGAVVSASNASSKQQSSLVNTEGGQLESCHLLHSVPMPQHVVTSPNVPLPHSWMKRLLLVTSVGSKATKWFPSALKSGYQVTTTQLIEQPPEMISPDGSNQREGFENPVFQFYERRTNMAVVAPVV